MEYTFFELELIQEGNTLRKELFSNLEESKKRAKKHLSSLKRAKKAKKIKNISNFEYRVYKKVSNKEKTHFDITEVYIYDVTKLVWESLSAKEYFKVQS